MEYPLRQFLFSDAKDDEIKLNSGGKMVAAKPRPEFESFSRLSYECHVRDIAGDPGGHRDLVLDFLLRSFQYRPHHISLFQGDRTEDFHPAFGLRYYIDIGMKVLVVSRKWWKKESAYPTL